MAILRKMVLATLEIPSAWAAGDPCRALAYGSNSKARPSFVVIFVNAAESNRPADHPPQFAAKSHQTTRIDVNIRKSKLSRIKISETC